MARPNTIELWRGASALTGEPIVALASCVAQPSDNDKTGDMVQTWIARQDLSPIQAACEGMDEAVCGDCKFRRAKKGGCYVALRAPQSSWRAWERGNVPRMTEPLRPGKPLRLGAHGEPTALPFEAWLPHLDEAQGWTGYTHQWKTCDQAYKGIIMASVDTDEEHEEAHDMGWRCFRTVQDDTWGTDGDILCPAYTHGVTCADCQLCNGSKLLDKRPDIIMPVHGYAKNRALQAISV